jgi:hypothetical protein
MNKRKYKDKIVSVPMDKPLVKAIKILSKEEKRPFSSMARILLNEALALRGKK